MMHKSDPAIASRGVEAPELCSSSPRATALLQPGLGLAQPPGIRAFRVRLGGLIGAFLVAPCLLFGAPASAEDQGAGAQSPPSSATPPAPVRALNPADWPEEIKEGYTFFLQACGDCHDSKLALQKRYASRTWRKYIVRMMRKPEVDFDANHGRKIYNFLRYYTKNL